VARHAPLAPAFADSLFSRNVEQRVAGLVAAEFRVRSTLALGEQTYVVLEPTPSQPTN